MNLQPTVPDSDANARSLFERAQYEGKPVAGLLIAIDRIERISDAGLRELLRTAVDGIVIHEPEAHDWQISHMGERVLVVCPGLSVQDAPQAARRLIEEARKLRITHGQRKLRATLSIGLAHNHQRPELVFDAFLGVAHESVGVAQGAGGNRWVHTELYDMLRRRFPDRAPAPPPDIPPAPAAEPPPASAATPPPSVAQGAVVKIHPHAIAPTPAPTPALPPPIEETTIESETVEILRRRVRKLACALEQAEEEIAALRGEQEGLGIASVYRTVQGLAPGEAFLDLKRKLMSDIFEANRRLQHVAHN